MAANARTAAKKAQARKVAKPRAAEPEGEFVPVRLTSNTGVEEEDRIVLFYVDDEPYTIPRKISRSHGLRYLDTAVDEGDAAATRELMINLMGEDGFDALKGCDDLTDEALGAVEEPEGKARRRR